MWVILGAVVACGSSEYKQGLGKTEALKRRLGLMLFSEFIPIYP